MLSSAREGVLGVRPRNAAATVALTLLLSGCGIEPMKPGPSHIRGDEPRVEGTIPPPVQITPVLPQPKPAARPPHPPTTHISPSVPSLPQTVSRPPPHTHTSPPNNKDTQPGGK